MKTNDYVTRGYGMRNALAILAVIFLSFGVTFAGEGGEKPAADAETETPMPEPAEDWTGKVVVVPIKGTMDYSPISGHSPILKGVQDAFERIKREPPRLVVVEVDSLGGSVLTCGLITEEILACKVPTVALVLKEAISGGALVSVSCNEIEMVKGSRIGDVQPMVSSQPGAPIDERFEEKIESYVRAVMEAHGEASDFPTKVLRAMVSRDIELYRVVYDNDEDEFLTKEEEELLERNIKDGVEKRKIKERSLVVREGDLLTLTPGKALEYGLAKRILDSREDFFAQRDIAMEDVVVASVQSTQEGGSLADNIKDLKEIDWGLDAWKVVLLAILLTIGVTGVIAEANAPGFGVPGACGIIGLACFFLVLLLEGHAEWYEVLLCIVGVALLVVEIVLIPGFGVPGLLGLIFLVGGLFLTFMPEFSTAPSTDVIWAEAANFVLMMMGAFVATCMFGYLVVTYGGNIPVMRAFYHNTSLASGVPVAGSDDAGKSEPHHDRHEHLIGKVGVSATSLRPAGKVKLDDGELIDVVTQGDLIDAETRVKVVDTSMNRIVVAPIAEEA